MAATAAVVLALASMIAMDRYVGTMLVPIGMAAGLAVRWTSCRGARWFALGLTVLGIAMVWSLLPGLVQGVANGNPLSGLGIAVVPLGDFFTKHYFHSVLDMLSPPLALVSAWFLAVPKQPVPAVAAEKTRITPD